MAKIPNLPPISSVSDPSVRAYLKALSDGWAVRNGTVGDGQEKFLTVNDLGSVLGARTGGASAPGAIGGGALQRATGGAISRAVAQLGDLYRRMTDDIMQSWVYKNLSSSIDEIGVPSWFTARVGAMIKTEKEERIAQNSALASRMDTAIARIDQNIALTRTELKATSDRVGATASAVTNLQTRVGDVTVKAQQAFTLSQTIDKRIAVSWGVKADVNGHVAGFGFGIDAKNGKAQSAFVVRTDTFAVFSPREGVEKNPFVLRDGVACMDTAFIQNASITGAMIAHAAIGSAHIGALAVNNSHIADLSVDTIKIAGKAVNETFSVRGDMMVNKDAITPMPFSPGPGQYVALGRLSIRHAAQACLLHIKISLASIVSKNGARAYVYLLRNRTDSLWSGHIGTPYPKLVPKPDTAQFDVDVTYTGTTTLVFNEPLAPNVAYEYGLYIEARGGTNMFVNPLEGIHGTRIIADLILQALYR